MARPSSTRDIEIELIEFGRVHLDKIATDAALLKGYTAFVEAASKAGAVVEATPYYGTVFYRQPNQEERKQQLEVAQSRWDEGEKYYTMMGSVGAVEFSWQENTAKTWAEQENQPWPPPHEPISDFDAVIRGIDEVTA